MPQPSVSVATRSLAEGRIHRNLTDLERCGVYQQLLDMTQGGTLPCTAFRDVSRQFNCNPRTVKRIWIRGQESVAAGSLAAIVSSKIRANSGCKATRTPGDIETAIKAVPHDARQTLRSLAAAVGISKSTILRHMQTTPRLKGRTSTVSPLLTDANMAARLAFAAVVPGQGRQDPAR
ncbi:hypothetical protein ACHHYP_06502 [Achlya hypogyna]|uniref:DUF7769 domain-containing protein n=1 Tax=Achlya hypogyna TaxID=1202772 RepID=A0A1V9YTP4_ACHHY|nr:hypothetical protein ACHHYP_06502 [Achlya hypogyna]